MPSSGQMGWQSHHGPKTGSLVPSRAASMKLAAPGHQYGFLLARRLFTRFLAKGILHHGIPGTSAGLVVVSSSVQRNMAQITLQDPSGQRD